MRRATVIALAALSAACAEAPVETTPPGGASVDGADVLGPEVVATVNGHGIRLDSVAGSARSARVEPEVALRRLEDETLLANAAAEAGYADDPDVVRATRQALVQALLARTAEAQTIEIADEAVEAAFEADLARWESPERRSSVHLLVRVAEDAPAAEAERAQNVAEAHLTRIAASSEPVAALRALQRQPSEEGSGLVIEDVPSMSRRAPADPAYLAALFGAPGPGLVPDLVRSGFGWHIIVVAEVEAAHETPREEALATLRAEMEAAARSRWTLGWIQQLVASHPVSVAPDAHARLASIAEAP